jgi:zinc protease
MNRILLGPVLASLLLSAPAPGAERPRRPDELTIAPLAFNPLAVRKDTLTCGTPVLFYENHDLPLLSVTIHLRMGTRFLPPDDFTACRMLSNLWQEGGTEALPPDSLDARLAALAASINAWVGSRSGSVSAFMTSEDSGKVLPLWRDILVHPRFDAERMERAKAQKLKDLQAIDNDPEQIADIRFWRLLDGPDYPGNQMDTRESIDAVGREDVERLHRRFVRPTNAVIGISGDFDPPRMMRTLNALLAGWVPADQDEPPVAAPWPPYPQPGVYFLRGEYEQNQVRIGRLYSGITNRSAEYPASMILSFAFGYGRVYYRTREEGLSYSTGVVFRVGEENASLFGRGSCRPDATGRLLRVILDEAARLGKEPLAEEELEPARVFQIGMEIRDQETPRAIVGETIDAIIRGLPEDYGDWKLRGLKNTNAAAVADLAERFVRFDDSTVVFVLGDPETFAGALDSLASRRIVELPPVRFGE